MAGEARQSLDLLIGRIGDYKMETFRYLESRLGLEGGNDPEDMPDAGDNSRGIGERGSF